MPTTFRYPNLVKLGGYDLTDESRGPLSEERDERSVEIELASGKKRKFIKGIHRKWDIEWEMIPDASADTVDGKSGRDDIRALAQSGNTMQFVIQDGKHSTETYTVFVSNYSEELKMRRTGQFTYSVRISLEEQG